MKTAAFVLAAFVLAFGADALAQSVPHTDPKSIEINHGSTDNSKQKKDASKSQKAGAKSSKARSSSSSSSAQLVDLAVKTLVVAARPQPVAAPAPSPVAVAAPAPAMVRQIASPVRAQQPVVHVKTPAQMAPLAEQSDLVRYNNDVYGVSAVPPPGFAPMENPNASLLFASPGGETLSVLTQQSDREGFRNYCRGMGKFELWKDVDTDLCVFAASSGSLIALEWMPSGHIVGGTSKYLEAKTLAKLVTTFATTFHAEPMQPGASLDAQLER